MFDEYSSGTILFSLNENSHKMEYLLLHRASGLCEIPRGNFEFGEDVENIGDFESKIGF
jgi:hypothetical protein